MRTKQLFRVSLIAMLGCLPVMGRAQVPHDRIEGAWLSESGKAKMLIYRTPDGTFNGKIAWLKEPLRDGKPKIDARNPDEHLRARPILGLQILKHLHAADDGEYEHGTIYDPQAGKTYDCKAEIRDDGQLALRGYVGMSLLGKTMIWKRSE